MMQSLIYHGRAAWRIYNPLMLKTQCKTVSHLLQYILTRSPPLFMNNMRTLRTLNPTGVKGTKSISITEANIGPNSEFNEITESDEFIEHIKTAEDREYILELIENNYGKLNEQHVYVMLNRLYITAKQLESSEFEEFTSVLHKDSRFQTLCVLLAKNGRFYNHNWVLNIISRLSFLGIDSDSNAMQVFLQLSKFLINDLTLPQVVHYGFILSAFKENQHVNVLRDALRKCALLKFDGVVELSLRHLAQFLDQHGECLNRTQLEIVSQAIVASKDRFNVPSLLVILKSISRLDFYDKALDSLCTREAISKLDVLFPVSVLDILQCCLKLNMYHTILYRNICQKVINEQWGVENTLKVCDILTHFRFRHVGIVNHLCSSLLDDISVFEELTSDDVSMIVRVLGELNGKVQGASEVLGHIVSRMEDSLWVAFSVDQLARVMKDLAIRGVYSTTLFQCLAIKLQTKDVKDMCSSPDMEVARNLRQLTFNLCLLKMAARVEHGDLTTMRIPTDLAQQFSPKPNSKTWSKMKNLINSSFGCETFVRSGLLTKYGLYIDNVLVLDGNNDPVNLWMEEGTSHLVGTKFALRNKQSLHPVPEDHKVVAVLMFTNSHFYKNIHMLRGRFMFYIRLLKHMGYSPVVVRYNELKHMPDVERQPYLKRLIQNASELQDFIQE
ncbi:unnamed protein product [Owenia fusiformis]|uniref:Uncharacterized protein n=1 Tax=Owenia fusiformis TaxID=6347 RepID=A0A8J1TQI1_OWEFU|nr:unnamed protein product [Owenia fusiformis]